MSFILMFGPVALLLVLFLFLLPIALLVALQVLLCRRGRRLGLILPGISLLLSLLTTLLIAFNMVGAELANLAVVGLILLITNIPTVIFGGIWLHFKGRQDTLEALKRMRIEDLE